MVFGLLMPRPNYLSAPRPADEPLALGRPDALRFSRGAPLEERMVFLNLGAVRPGSRPGREPPLPAVPPPRWRRSRGDQRPGCAGHPWERPARSDSADLGPAQPGSRPTFMPRATWPAPGHPARGPPPLPAEVWTEAPLHRVDRPAARGRLPGGAEHRRPCPREFRPVVPRWSPRSCRPCPCPSSGTRGRQPATRAVFFNPSNNAADSYPHALRSARQCQRGSRAARRDVSAAVVPVLAHALEHSSCSQERLALVRALGTLGPAARQAVPVLTACLRGTSEPAEQRAVLLALDQMGPAAVEAVPVLTALTAQPRRRRGPASFALIAARPGRWREGESR